MLRQAAVVVSTSGAGAAVAVASAGALNGAVHALAAALTGRRGDSGGFELGSPGLARGNILVSRNGGIRCRRTGSGAFTLAVRVGEPQRKWGQGRLGASGIHLGGRCEVNGGTCSPFD